MAMRLRFASQPKLVKYATLIVVLALLVGVGFGIWKWASPQPKKVTAVANNSVVRSYRNKLPGLKAAVQKSPNSFSAHRDYAQALYVTGDKQAAKTEYEAAAKLNPHDASTQNSLGNVYRDLGEYDQAQAVYRAAFSQDPSFINAYVNLATLQAYTLGKPAAAVSTYKLAITKNGQSPELLLLLGGAYEQNKQTDLAISTYRSVLTKDPNNAAAKRNLERLNK